MGRHAGRVNHSVTPGSSGVTHIAAAAGRHAETTPVLPAIGVVAVLLVWLPAGAALADGQESGQASVLVEQAIALIANDAGDERVAERIRDALEAPDTEGVDLAKVDQSLDVIGRPGEDSAAAAQARALLLESVGGKLPSAPQQGRPAVGAETGTSVILDEFKPRAGISNGGDAVVLAVALAGILAGTYLAWRMRPAHVRQLTDARDREEQTR